MNEDRNSTTADSMHRDSGSEAIIDRLTRERDAALHELNQCAVERDLARKERDSLDEKYREACSQLDSVTGSLQDLTEATTARADGGQSRRCIHCDHWAVFEKCGICGAEESTDGAGISVEAALAKDLADALSRLADVVGLKDKLILDTGHGCSVCRDTPVVNIPSGSGTYWLCGGCVAERLDELESERAALAKAGVISGDDARRFEQELERNSRGRVASLGDSSPGKGGSNG